MSDIIVFLGMPGSGKGTYAENLEKDFGYKHLSTGEILRKEIENKSLIGEKINKIINCGNFVCDEIVFKIVSNIIKNDENYILDGFPRNLNQASFLKNYLKQETKNQLKGVLYFELPTDVAIKRLLNRGRKDDILEIIKNRLDIYLKETKPLIEFYKKENLLISIDSNDTIENVYKNILKRLNF